MKPSTVQQPGTDTLPGRIDWKCGTCGKPTRTGALHIDLQDVRKAERALGEWERRPRDSEPRAFDLGEILLMPRVEQWRIDCNTCCHSCAGCYSIDLARCQSVYALIRWTAHLYDKNWFTATNWISFIAEVARDHGSQTEATGVH